MNSRDMRHATSEEKRAAVSTALFTEAVDTLLANKIRDDLKPGEAHIVIETEATEDGLNMMVSCVASLSSPNKVSIVHNMIKHLDFSPMETLMLLLQAKDMMEAGRPDPSDMMADLFGPSRNPFAQ